MLNAILALPVRRCLVEHLLREAARAAAAAAATAAAGQVQTSEVPGDYERLCRSVGHALGLERSATAVELQRLLMQRGERGMARRVERAARARHLWAHPDPDLVREVLAVLGTAPETEREVGDRCNESTGISEEGVEGFYMGDETNRRRYCMARSVSKPDRTHRCCFCNKCIWSMDHH